MSDPPEVPRPREPASGALADRMRALRGDARVGVALLVCVAVAAGVAWFRAGVAPSASAAPAAATSTTGAPVGVSTPSEGSGGTAFAPTSTTLAAIVIDVVGAVRDAGIVRLPAGARVVDAIRAAGGAVRGADLARLNLAAPLADGARVAVPAAGAPPPAVDPAAVTGGSVASGSPDGTASGASAGPGATTPIDVNTATAEQLDALPGIGPSLAAAIVQERERNGPFRSVDDLTRVPGIGDGRLARLRDLVTV